MEQLIKTIESLNGTINGFVWGPVMLVLLVGTGVFFTARTNVLQVRKFGYAMKNTIMKVFHKDESTADGDISPFQALTTALAATVGTGNIVDRLYLTRQIS